MALTMNKTVNGVIFDVKFEDKLCLIHSPSGTGKSFLLRTLKEQSDSKGIACLYVNVENVRNISDYSSYLVVLFDDAGLYLETDMVQSALAHAEFVIVGTNRLNYASLYGCGCVCGWYDIDFRSNILQVKRETYV